MQVLYHVEARFIGSTPLLIILDKRCTTCLQFKSCEDFHNSNVTQDKLKTACKECRKDPNVKSFNTQLVTSADTRICTDCLKEKELSSFDKGQSQCKECRSEYNRQFRLDNHEHYLAYDRSRIGNSERKENHNKWHKIRYATDPLYVEKRHIRRKARYQANPLEAREHVLRRRARKKSAHAGRVSFKRILERDGYFCYICEKPIDPHAKKRSRESLTFDHQVPLQPRPGEPQGAHSEDNLHPAHHVCNVRKGNKPFELLDEIDRRGP